MGFVSLLRNNHKWGVLSNLPPKSLRRDCLMRSLAVENRLAPRLTSRGLSISSKDYSELKTASMAQKRSEPTSVKTNGQLKADPHFSFIQSLEILQ